MNTTVLAAENPLKYSTQLASSVSSSTSSSPSSSNSSLPHIYHQVAYNGYQQHQQQQPLHQQHQQEHHLLNSNHLNFANTNYYDNSPDFYNLNESYTASHQNLAMHDLIAFTQYQQQQQQQHHLVASSLNESIGGFNRLQNYHSDYAPTHTDTAEYKPFGGVTSSTNTTSITTTTTTVAANSGYLNQSNDVKFDANSPISTLDTSPSSALASSSSPTPSNSMITDSTTSNNRLHHNLNVDESPYLLQNSTQNDDTSYLHQQQAQLLLQQQQQQLHHHHSLQQHEYSTDPNNLNHYNLIPNSTSILDIKPSSTSSSSSSASSSSASPPSNTNEISVHHYTANPYNNTYYNRLSNTSPNLYDIAAVAAMSAGSGTVTNTLYDTYNSQQLASRPTEDYLAYSFLNGVNNPVNSTNSSSPHSNSSSSYQTTTSSPPPASSTIPNSTAYMKYPSAVTVAAAAAAAAAAAYATSHHHNTDNALVTPSCSSTSSTTSSSSSASSSNSTHRTSNEIMYNGFKTATNLANNINFDTNTIQHNITANTTITNNNNNNSNHNSNSNKIHKNPLNNSLHQHHHNHPHHSHSRLQPSSLPVPVPSTNLLNTHQPPQDVPPNQLCAVCGDNAACQHYGVRTCEGCKGFFKRTVQKSSKYVCLADKNCPVDKRRRNRCQYCRFQKCLAVGMVKEVVRTNDLKGRRGRLPTKPKSPNIQANRSQQSAFLSQIIRVYSDTIPNQTAYDFSKYRKITKESVRVDEEPFWILQSLSRSCEIIKQWAEKFSNLCRIPNIDKDRMFFSNLLDLLILRVALRMQENVERIVLCNAVVFHKTQIACVLSSTILQQIQDLGNKLRQPDPSISSLLTALVFLQDPQQVPMNELYCKIRDFLKDLCHHQQQQQQQQQNSYENSNQINYHLQLTEIFMQLRQISLSLKQRLKQYNSMYSCYIQPNSILDFYLQNQDQSQLALLGQQTLLTQSQIQQQQQQQQQPQQAYH